MRNRIGFEAKIPLDGSRRPVCSSRSRVAHFGCGGSQGVSESAGRLKVSLFFLQIRVRPVGLAPEPGAKMLHLATQTTRRPSWTDLPERIGTSFKIKIPEQGILLFRAPPQNGVSATGADPSTIEGRVVYRITMRWRMTQSNYTDTIVFV